MALTIEINSAVEQRLRREAQAAGLSLDSYASQIIHQSLSSETSQVFAGNRLSKKESDLLEIINGSLSEIDWPQYQVLIEKRGDETLSEEEYGTLLVFTGQLESANLARMEAIAALAQLRNVSIDDLMKSLDLETKQYI